MKARGRCLHVFGRAFVSPSWLSSSLLCSCCPRGCCYSTFQGLRMIFVLFSESQHQQLREQKSARHRNRRPCSPKLRNPCPETDRVRSTTLARNCLPRDPKPRACDPKLELRSCGHPSMRLVMDKLWVGGSLKVFRCTFQKPRCWRCSGRPGPGSSPSSPCWEDQAPATSKPRPRPGSAKTRCGPRCWQLAACAGSGFGLSWSSRALTHGSSLLASRPRV